MKKTTTKKNKGKEQVVEMKPIQVKNYYYILGLIVFFVFANTISGGYNLDDELVTMNHRFTSQGLTAVKDIFTNSYYADAMGYAYGYRPMVHLSFAIEHQFFSESPKVSHFFNVLLYVLSIVLFFKLLLKWFGVEQLKLAFLAVILFALHPVHTEVVASIKNRDEILAFLFIILTGLSMVKYMDRRKVSSLIWIVALFTMAMLSKKSAYPMAIVLPVAFVLFQNLSRNQLILISLAVIFPAAIVGSELSVTRMLLMIILPIFGIGLVYIISTQFIQKGKKINLKPLLSKPIIPALFTLIITSWSMFTFNFNGLFLTIPFLFWILRLNLQVGLITLTLISMALTIEYDYREFGILSVLISFGYGFYLITKSDIIKNTLKPILIWSLITILAIIIFMYDLQLTKILLLINFCLTFWLVFKKPFLGIIFTTLTLCIAFLVSKEIDFNLLSLVLFSILMAFKDKLKSFNWLAIFITLIFSGLITYISFEYYQPNSVYTTTVTEYQTETQKIITTPEQNSFLKEGRQLEFAENTLVAPHTTQETIGTGAATLGEYIRLMVFPNELSFYYGFARMDTVSLSNPFVWISILIHLGLILLAIWQLRKRPIISFGILWYLLSIILFSNWVELVAGMVAERLIFIASAGFCIFIAGLVYWIKPHFLVKKPFILEGTVAVILIFFALKTIDRNTMWKDPLTLMGNDIKHLQNSAQANNLYALRLMEYSSLNMSIPQEERNEIHQTALKHFSQAIQIDSTFFNAVFDKGRAAQFAGDTQTAIETFKIAIQKQPDFLDSYQFLLMEYEKVEDWTNYLNTAKKLLSQSNTPNTYDFISKGFFMQNQADSSLIYIKQGLSIFPNDPNLLDRKNYLETVVTAN